MPAVDSVPAVARGKRWWFIATLGFIFSVAMFIVTQVSMLITRPDWAISSFRSFFAPDQLSYLAMVVNGAEGRFDNVEPFTETGVNNYPHLYYTLLGVIAHVTGISPGAVWSITGLCLQAILVLGIAAACVALTGRAWTAFLGPVPLLLGTFSWAVSGTWFTQLGSHATMWGPFAPLFPVNGEAAALCVVGLALLSLIVGASKRLSRRGWVLLGAVIAIAIGTLANVQTYSFLSAVYLAVYGLAAYAIATRPKVWLIALSVALAPALILVGPLLAPGLGALPTLALGLAPALPGLVLLLVRTKGLLAIPGVLGLLAAAPQILGTAMALGDGDPFLNYRVSSSVNLGVPWRLGVIGAIALLIPLILIFVSGIRARNRLWIAHPIAVVFVWAILSKNDVWGANQEPYRFWIDCFLLAAVTTVPLFVDVAIKAWTPLPRTREAGSQIGLKLAVVGTTAVMVLSMYDWVLFYGATRGTVLWSFTDGRSSALSEAATDAGDGLILPDTCIDPHFLKAASGQRVAYYNFGLAWPDHQEEMQSLLDTRHDDELPSFAAFKAAGVDWVMTDSGCDIDWASTNDGLLERATTATYEDPSGRVTITLWRVVDTAG